MKSYFFTEPGSIPGVPGLFAHCRVDIDEHGNLTKTPPDFVAPEQSEDAPEAIVEEQAAPTPAPQFIGG